MRFLTLGSNKKQSNPTEMEQSKFKSFKTQWIEQIFLLLRHTPHCFHSLSSPVTSHSCSQGLTFKDSPTIGNGQSPTDQYLVYLRIVYATVVWQCF
ncbi:hypothetical protein OUZ56_020626 [Daphnia magna]|uniref:Uncharacterized protein n=1 Tax=Daphnia magna TaxID=35525 RepID=A0ABQ9ZF75_9CRUS|nr:hypothetical protein OUZ56_020626 [Daphnia magna]